MLWETSLMDVLEGLIRVMNIGVIAGRLRRKKKKRVAQLNIAGVGLLSNEVRRFYRALDTINFRDGVTHQVILVCAIPAKPSLSNNER